MTADIVILFPIIEMAVHGYPQTVRLSRQEQRAVGLFAIGWDAVRNHGVKWKTINSLALKGVIDHDGLTQLGKAVAERMKQPTDN